MLRWSMLWVPKKGSSKGQAREDLRSPRLLEARCHSIEEMALVNDLCRLVEDAEGSRG
jgi:hypothetical protein